MGMFRKKPVEIEAHQFLVEEKTGAVDGFNILRWVVDNNGQTRAHIRPDGVMDQLLIGTLEGEMLAVDGDWIIKGVMGEMYPCKPDIFEATYEAVS